MSETEDLPDEAKSDGPRFRRPEQRRRVALARYYGMGDREWEMDEIAEYLRVSEATVKKYLHNSEMGEKCREMFPAAEEQMKMDILLDKKKRLDEIREMWESKLEEKDISVTNYRLESVRGQYSFSGIDNVENDPNASNTIRLDAPHPETFDERSKLDGEARAILREIRKHENDIREMLSLDEPDEVTQEHTSQGVVHEQKIYNFGGMDDEMPDAKVVEVDARDVEDDE